MLSPLWIILLFIDCMESGIAFVLNTYIIIISGKSIGKGPSLNPFHLIHLLMGLVNIILQICQLVQGSLYLFCISLLFVKDVYLPLIIITLTMIYCSFWLTAWLCAYYCTSITSFRYGLCVWLQRISSSSLLLLLLLTAAGTFLIGLLSIWKMNVEIEVKVSENSTLGSSSISGTFNFYSFCIIVSICLGCFLPFSLILCSIILTISSLLRHVHNMKQSDSRSTRPNLQAHINAIRTIIMILTVFAIFCIAEIMSLTTKISSSSDFKLLLIWSIVLYYPLAESIIIIQASSKLRAMIVEMVSAVCRRNTKPET